jgi:hypothetical protein
MKMAIIPTAIYRLNVIPIRNKKEINSKIHLET